MKSVSLVLLATILFASSSTHFQNPPPQRIIDLNGLWKDGKRLVSIGQTGTHVIAIFKPPYPMCKPGGGKGEQEQRKDFEGTIDVQSNVILGKIVVCNTGEKWKEKIGLQEVPVTLAISDDQNTLSGTYEGWPGPKQVTITRECKPDAQNLCNALNRAIQGMAGAISASPSTSHYQSLQQKIGTELNTIRRDLCDKPDALDQLKAIQEDLNSLKFVSGQSNLQNNRALGRIERDLKSLSSAQCSAFNPPPPPSCATGAEPKSETDTSYLNFFKKPLETNLTLSFSILPLAKTKRCLTEMFNQPCAPTNFLKDFRVAANSWSEGTTYMDVCKQMCQSLGDWYESSPCSKGGLEKKQVVDKCFPACLKPEFTQ